MTIPELSGIAIVCLGVISVMITLNNKSEQKRKRIYQRLDEVKLFISNTYVSKEIWSISYTGLKDDVHEIKTDLKLLLRKSGIESS